MKDELLALKRNCHLSDADVLADLLQPLDVGKDYCAGDNNYVWFYLIGKYLRPKFIVEMGSRFGYSMRCFVSGAAWASDQYILRSFDAEVDGIDCLRVFQDYFSNVLKIKDLIIKKTNTQSLDSLKIKGADLCFVDAEHTAPGCYHECQLGWDSLRPGGVLVVDDMHDAGPKDGCEKFCREMGVEPIYLPSFRGIYLAEKSLLLATLQNSSDISVATKLRPDS